MTEWGKIKTKESSITCDTQLNISLSIDSSGTAIDEEEISRVQPKLRHCHLVCSDYSMSEGTDAVPSYGSGVPASWSCWDGGDGCKGIRFSLFPSLPSQTFVLCKVLWSFKVLIFLLLPAILQMKLRKNIPFWATGFATSSGLGKWVEKAHFGFMCALKTTDLIVN